MKRLIVTLLFATSLFRAQSAVAADDVTVIRAARMIDGKSDAVIAPAV